jgi:hemin uptake protein HemP
MTEQTSSTHQPLARIRTCEASAKDALTPASVESQTLLQGRKTLLISHGGAVYRLQATRLGKLILTK